MIVKHEEPVRCYPDSTDTIRVGVSTWTEELPADEQTGSIKYAWLDSRGQVCRGGEFPVEALPQMLEVAIREGYLTLPAPEIRHAVAA